MVLATNVSTDAFVEFLSCGLPKDVTDYSYEEAVARLRLIFSKEHQCSKCKRTGYLDVITSVIVAPSSNTVKSVSHR
jgi:hypothetical protein